MGGQPSWVHIAIGISPRLAVQRVMVQRAKHGSTWSRSEIDTLGS